MPKKALVAFGAVLGSGLFALAAPLWSGAAIAAPAVIGRPDVTSPQHPQQPAVAAAPGAPVLTLDDVLQRILQQNPVLEAFSHELEARQGEARQAGLLPNPELSIEVENVAGSGAFAGTDSAETTLQLSQRFELGDKRARRRELALREREMAAQELARARAELLAAGRGRFDALLAAQERLAISGEEVELAEEGLRAAEERIASGKAAAIDRLRFQALLAEARLGRSRAEQGVVAARRALAALWGGPAEECAAVAGSLAPLPLLPDWDALVERIEQSPAVALGRGEADRAGRQLELERAGRRPDLTVGLGVRNDQASGDNALVASLSLPLPLFDRNQGRVAAARARQDKARAEERAARLRLEETLAATWQRLQVAHTEAAMLRDELLPAARQGYEATAYGYRAGKFGFLELLEAQRTLSAAQSRYLEALAASRQALAELDGMLGAVPAAGAPPTASPLDARGQS